MRASVSEFVAAYRGRLTGLRLIVAEPSQVNGPRELDLG